MKCLMRYEWVKLLRSHLPDGKGILGMWARLASRAAFRKGIASYCGYENEVVPGMWSGGIVGVKSILGARSRKKAFETLDILSELGYIRYTLDGKTKKLTYQITDWVIRCSGEECMNGTVYTTNEYGFLCIPRNITERLIEHNYIFEEADAWLDLWCHSVSKDRNNAFSFLAPIVQYGKYCAVLTLETLGKRWGWEKTKVWRFFKKYGDVFTLYRLPGSYGSLMSDLNGDTLMAQVLTNVIIGNTSSGKGDHFWDNGEGNLLKALILYIDQDRTRSPDMKNLPAVYQMLTQNSERQLTALFEKLPLDHPARAPYNLFAQASDTVRSGIVLGLGTRLQVLQNQSVRNITSRSEIDLSAPGKRKCAYYIILSDQDATMAFLSSLFFSFLFIKLTRYADSTKQGHCNVPVNLILDEFNNVGKIGSAEDGSDFARSLSVVRSRDIRVMLAVQSLGQLQNRYPNNLWSEIIGNCDIQLMLGCTDDVTAKHFSDRSGDMSIQINSTMTVRQTIAMAQVIPQYRQTEGQGRRKLLTPDEVLRLPNEELLCVVHGYNILKLNKLDYTRHPMSKKIQRVSIMDYTPKHYPQTDFENRDTNASAMYTADPIDEPKSARKKKLYSSAAPPSEF